METKINYYKILNNWLYDRNKYTPIPKELKDTKKIPTTILLYHFKYSKYIKILSELFNSYNIYQMPINDVLKLLKYIIYKTGYKPPFVKYEKIIENKLLDILKKKYPYLKKVEIAFLCNKIENSEKKDFFYKMFGLKKDYEKKKIKKLERENKKEEFKKLKQTLTVEDLLSDI